MAARSTEVARNRFHVRLYHNAVPVARCWGEWAGVCDMWVAGGPIRYSRNTRLDVEILPEGMARGRRIEGVVSDASGRALKLSLSPDLGQELREHGGGAV